MKRLTVFVCIVAIGLMFSGCALVGTAPEVEAVAFAVDPAYAVELVAYSDAVSFEWRIDGQVLHGKRVVCQLEHPGQYVATVVATGSNGVKTTSEIAFAVDFAEVCFWEDSATWTCTRRPGDDLR